MTDEDQPESEKGGASAPLPSEEHAKRSKAERLDNWGPFDVHRWSDYPEVNAAVNEIFRVLKTDPEFDGNDGLRKRHVKVLVLDLYAKWLTHPERYMGVYFKESEYRAKSRYNAIHVSKLTPKVVKALERHGYVELEPGHYGRTGGHSSHVTRIRPTDKLLSLIKNKHGWKPQMVQQARNRECIELRDYNEEKDRQVPVEYEDTPETIRMRQELTAYNNLIRSVHVDIPRFPKEGVKSKNGRRTFHLPRDQKFTRRIFANGSFAEGGRFYGGWWQQVPNNAVSGNWREQIFINGFPVKERDYSGLHIVLLYAMEGIDYWDADGEDPYALPGYEESERMRELLKLALLIAVNAEDKTKTLQGLRGAINEDYETHGWVYEEGLDLAKVIDDFADRHSPIKKHLFSGAGTKLQRLDSTIAESVMRDLTAKGIPVLLVHDSFIVPFPAFPDLEEAMDRAFARAIEEMAPLLYEKIPRVKEAGLGGRPWHILQSNRDDFIDYVSRVPYEYPDYGKRLREHQEQKLTKDYYSTEPVEFVVPEDGEDPNWGEES